MKHTDEAQRILRATEATITLLDGESIAGYREKLGDAARLHCVTLLSDAAVEAGYDPTMDDLGVEDPDFRASVEDATATDVIMWCRRDHPWMELYLRMPYQRGADGVFAFGGHTPVVPKRVYEMPPDGAGVLASFIGTTLPATEASSPAMSARKNLPAAAYAAPFFAGEGGAYDAKGTFQRSKSKLPFHTNGAKSVDATETVDVPRLRNALARFDQTDFAEFGSAAESVKATAKGRLDKAAKALLPAVKAAAKAGEAVLRKMPGAPTKADADGFVTACEAFERTSLNERVGPAMESLGALALRSLTGAVKATEAAEVQRDADAVLADAKRLGIETPEIGKLRRRSVALSMARVHDVAAGTL